MCSFFWRAFVAEQTPAVGALRRLWGSVKMQQKQKSRFIIDLNGNRMYRRAVMVGITGLCYSPG